MPIKRALWISIVAYVATFIIALAVALGLRNSAALMSLGWIGDAIWYGGAAFSIIIMALATWWYFRAPDARASVGHGALFGLIAIAVGFVLDILSILPVGSTMSEMVDLYLQASFFISLAIILATTTATAFVLARWHRAHVPLAPAATPHHDEETIRMNDDIADMADSDEFNA